MPASNYPNGFPFGVTIRGLPITVAHPGKVFWVNNSTVLADAGIGGSNGNPGTYQKPFSTIDYAIGRCTANRGDIIMVMPGHAETVDAATDILMDVAGIAIVGLGTGTKRPTLTFSVAATANIPITAVNMSIKNVLFVANFADVASVFTATGTAAPKDFCVENCEFRDTSSILNFMTVVTGNATANSMDGFTFTGNRISSLGTMAATTAIVMAEAANRVQIRENFGVWAILNDTAAMFAGGAFNFLSFDFANNVLNRPNTSSTGGSFISGSGTTWTGTAYGNLMWQLDATAGIWIPTGTKLGFFENYSPITGGADKSGLINPAAG